MNSACCMSIFYLIADGFLTEINKNYAYGNKQSEILCAFTEGITFATEKKKKGLQREQQVKRLFNDN